MPAYDNEAECWAARHAIALNEIDVQAKLLSALPGNVPMSLEKVAKIMSGIRDLVATINPRTIQ